MQYLVKREDTYAKYVATHSVGGAMYALLERQVSEGTMTQEARDYSPISESDWIEQQGSLEGGITESMEFPDDQDLSGYGPGWVLMTESEYNSAIDEQEKRVLKVLGQTSTEDVTLTLTNKIVVDNFQDIKDVAFSLKLRNTTGDALKGVLAVIEGVPYKEIPDVTSDVELVHTVVEGPTGFDHSFELQEDLAGYGKVNISGGKLTEFGVGNADGALKLYAKA